MIDDKFTNNSDKQLDSLPLHDIQGLVEVSDYSLVMFTGIIVVGLFLIVSLLFFLWKFLKNRKKENLRKDTYRELKSIDFSNAKQAAYDITRLGLLFKDDSERVHNKYYALIDRLSQYKYQKNIDKTFDEESKAYYKNFLDMLEV